MNWRIDRCRLPRRGGWRFEAVQQLRAVSLHDAHQLVILDIAQAATEMDLAQEPQMRNELTQANVGGEGPNLAKGGQCFALQVGCHGSKSPIFGSAAKAFGS